ncbi:hypothetical protein [Arsenicibacter rosenii]|uniref:Uncharacterized protein n=1 Tax=Arsenicibacter rosenii TaxID=1750698 RepID=A0A1S2VQU3_9BACT|nr:hypothetical protein [Arsenicibacter rosenii]OIN60760.1 hypothetical protein BLX24_01265 [Arsenicibacter rosenii]
MAKGLIRLSYRKLIDASSVKTWDQYVFEDTWKEFYMQSQFYNQAGSCQTFQELLDQVPGADRLHYLTSTAAAGYIRQLNQVIPDIANVSGKLCLPFSQFRFEIVHSHVSRKEAHKVAISFYSDPLTWIDTIGNNLLIAYGDQREALSAGQELETDMIALQPYLSVSFFTKP